MEDPEARNRLNDFETIINKIDNTMFRTLESHYKNFKKFDRDQDGYVSTNDMKKTLSKMNVINEKEIDVLLKEFDRDQKGFFNFKEFHQKLRNDMTNHDEDVRKK